MSAVLTETHRPAIVARTEEQSRIAGIVREFRLDIERLGGVSDFQHGLAVGRLICERTKARVASSQKLAPMTAGWHAGRCEALLDMLLPLVRSDDDMAAITSARARVRALLMGEQS